MARGPKTTYELTEAEQRDLITLIQQGKPLPERYRFILFDDKREVELLWNGKTRDVCTTVLPFQSLEHIDEPRKETKLQGDLFDFRGRQLKGWTNKLIWGDNKLVLSSLRAGSLREQIQDAGGVKLVYIDPPFDVGADFSMDVEIGEEVFHKDPTILEHIAYRDTWGRGPNSFIAMLYERLILIRDILASDGSIFVHCDWRMNSAIRLILDEVFGREFFVNEIAWCYKDVGGGMNTPFYKRKHDTIFWYSKTENYRQGRIARGTLSETTLDRFSSLFDEHGVITYRRFKEMRPTEFETRRRQGRAPDDLDEVFLSKTSGRQLEDWWTDINPLRRRGVTGEQSEIFFYPTQKPEDLIARIIESASQPGDIVADFFVGSGTTAVVAEKLERKWLASDLGKFAIHGTRKRLIATQRELQSSTKPFRAFEVLNLGRYERQAYLNVGGRLTGKQKEEALALREREFRDLILKAYKATGFGGDEGAPAQDGFFHGARNGRLVVVGPINLPVGRLFVEEVIVECRKRNATRVDVLAFEFEMGLFPAALAEAKAKGIDLAPKYIPAEVFDKRAVEKGQVVFHDISFVDAKAIYDKKRKLTLCIKLADFSVYYSQGAAEAAIESIKGGKSGVICDRGQLYKVSKDRDGVVTKDRLTKEWTDWVDYWAVDFDYESRKEIIKVPVGTGISGVATLPGMEEPQSELALPAFEERWTGAYIFENEWQSFRTQQSRDLELITAEHTYDTPGRYTVAVKVIDIFGNDTMTLVPVNVG